MLFLVWLLTLMQLTEAGDLVLLQGLVGDSLVLPAGGVGLGGVGLGGGAEGGAEGGVEGGVEVRWTHPRLLVRSGVPPPPGCRLLADGSLSLERLKLQDAGRYTLEAFSPAGIRTNRREYLLQITDSSSSPVLAASGCLLLLLLLLLGLLLFVLRRRRRRRGQRGVASGETQENVYVAMLGLHGNRGHQEGGGKNPKEEESPYGETQENPYVAMFGLHGNRGHQEGGRKHPKEEEKPPKEEEKPPKEEESLYVPFSPPVQQPEDL